MKIVIWAERSPRYADRLLANPLPEGTSVYAATNKEEALALAPEADVLVCWGGDDVTEFLRAAPNLKLIHAMGAGVEGMLTPAVVASPVPVANARGCNAPGIADHVMALVLALCRNIHRSVRNQARKVWEKKTTRGGEIAGATLGILGLGAIGTETARRAKGLGMRVVSLDRGKPKPPEVDELLPDMGSLFAASDYLLNALPLTKETEKLIGEAELSRMKPDAYFINVGRGRTVDEAALVRALQEGRIAGAALDVMETEPLPEESPLWEMENVIITPHVAGLSPYTMNRIMALVAENLRRLAAGEPLRNLVDKHRGY